MHRPHSPDVALIDRRNLVRSVTMNCPQSVKWIGVLAGIVALYAFISMYPDMKRYVKLERM